MLHNIEKLKPNALIDFVIAVAHRGGVENVMNQVARYLTGKGLRIRFIQLIYEHQPWTCKEAEFHYIYEQRNGQSLETFINGYYSFLQEHPKPNMIVATNWPMMCTVARAAIEKSGITVPIASWLHNPLVQYESSGYGGIEHLKNADIHFAINDSIKNLLLSNDEKLVYRSYNPTGTALHFNDARDPYKLVFIGRLSDQKNLHIVIKALKLTKDYELFIIGDGDEAQALKNLVKDLSLESRVTFYGWNDDPWSLAKNCGFLVMSSLFEGFPLTVVEALQCGIPVISTPVDGIIEIINNGINGYLYPHNDYKFLAQILNHINDGSLEIPSSAACQSSVLQYRTNVALFNFYAKINATLEGRIIQESNDKISVVVPCFNSSSTVEHCINSILNQTLPKEMFEIILINDSSTDNTLDILARYEEEYPEQIVVVNCEENVSLENTVNIGTIYASGNYIMYVNADDCITDTILEKMYLATIKYPVDMVEYQSSIFGDNGYTQPHIAPKQDTLIIFETIEERLNYFISDTFDSSIWRRLYKRSFIEAVKSRSSESLFTYDMHYTQSYICSLRSIYIINE